MKEKDVIWSNIIDKILVSGVLLKSNGINNYALTRSQALEALDRFDNLNIHILGGDVYFKSGEKFIPNYDNWHYEINESNTKNCSASIDVARNYIIHYPMTGAYFCLVPQVEKNKT